MRRHIIILGSNGIGGAERRALKIAHFLCESSIDVTLVLNQDLLQWLHRDSELSFVLSIERLTIEVFEERKRPILPLSLRYALIKKFDELRLYRLPTFVGKIILGGLSFQSQLRRLVLHDSVIHCLGTDAARLGVLLESERLSKNGNKVVVEIVGHKMIDRLSRQAVYFHEYSRYFQFGAVSESVFIQLNSAFNRTGYGPFQLFDWEGAFVTTPNNSFDVSKRNHIVFASRFNPPKNPILFSRAITKVLMMPRFSHWTVSIRGRGSLEGEIKSIVAPLQDRCSVGFTSMLSQELAESKVFVSLIETGDFPSQGLFESLFYGCYPVLSDSGNTRHYFDKYVKRYTKLDEKDTVNFLVALLDSLNSDTTVMEEYYFLSPEEMFSDVQSSSGYVKKLFQFHGK